MKEQCKQYPEKRVSPEPQKSPHVTFCLLLSPQGNHLSRLLTPQTNFAGFKILRWNLKGCALLCQALLLLIMFVRAYLAITFSYSSLILNIAYSLY